MRCDHANGENITRSARTRSKVSAAIRGSRFGLVSDVAGMLGSSEAPARTGHSLSLLRVEIDNGRRESWSS